MANSNNVYANAAPLQGNVSDWVDGQERMDFAYREEQRKIGELDRLAKEREQAKKDAQLKKYEDFKGGKPTGIKSVDEAQTAWYNQAMDKNLELYKKEKSGQALTPQEASQLKKIQNLPDTIALLTKSYQDDVARYYDGVKTGKIKRDPDYELKLAKMPEKGIAFLDDDLNPVIGMDNDGDGKPDIISYDLNGLSLKPNFVENVDLEDSIKKVTANIEPNRTVTDQNMVKKTNEFVPLSLAKSTATNMVIAQDGSLTPLAKSYFHDAGVKDFDSVTDKQIQSFQELLTKRIVNSKKRIDETDKDYAAIQAAKPKPKTGKEEKVYSINDLSHTADAEATPVKVTKDADGNVLSKTPTGTKEKYGNVYQGNVNIKRKVGQQEEIFESFGVDKKGDVTVTVNVAKPKYSAAELNTMTENIEDPEERQTKINDLTKQRGNITSKTYKSSSNPKEVSYYAQRFKDPDTDEYIQDISQLRSKLKGLGGDNFDTPAKPATQEKTKPNASNYGSKYNDQ